MTINEVKTAIDMMRVQLKAKCQTMENCDDCPLNDNLHAHDGCYNEWVEDDQVVENYNIMFRDEKVNHPVHYQGKNECIDVMIAMFGVDAVKHFCMCNAYKYRFRADKKNGEEDIAKAEWYETKLIELGGV